MYPKVSKSTDNRMKAFEAFANCIGLSSELISDGALEIGGTRKQPWRFMCHNHTKSHATKRAYQSSKVETAIRIIMTCTKSLISQRNVPKRLWDYVYQYESTISNRVRQPKLERAPEKSVFGETPHITKYLNTILDFMIWVLEYRR